MKKIMIFLALFLLVLFSGDRLLSIGLGKLAAKSQNRFINIYKAGTPDDIIILGNSRADRHFPAAYLSKLLGKKVTNLGLGGIPTLLEKELLEDYIEKKGAPKLVILEVTNLNVPPNKIGGMRLFGVYSERIRKITKQYNPKLYYSGYIFHLFRFNSEMFFRVLNGINHRQSDRMHKSVIDADLIQKIIKNPPVTITNYSENETALKDIINLASKYNIKLRLVITPFFPDLIIANYSEWKSSLKKDITFNHKLWDYSQFVIHRDGFRDSYHLNISGVMTMLHQMLNDKLFNI